MFPGSTLSDHCLRYQNIPDIKLIVVLGELGGYDEYSLVDALKTGQISKPVVAWVSGTCAKLFKSEVQFGHAGAKSGGASESAQVCDSLQQIFLFNRYSSRHDGKKLAELSVVLCVTATYEVLKCFASQYLAFAVAEHRFHKTK